MEHVSLELTIYFENGFYYGLFEQENAQGLSVCRVTFGVEPQMNEVLEFVNQKFSQLQFSPAVALKKKRHCANPKRLQRLAKKEKCQFVPKKEGDQLMFIQFISFFYLPT